MNRSLTLSFAQVHGAEILTRWKREDGVELTSLLKVGLSQTPSGDTIVERLRETRAARWGEIGREVHRTLLRPGGENRFSTSVEFKAVPGRGEDYGSMLEARGDQYVISEMRGTQRTGRSPRGILPPSLVDLVVAAQPGPLPERLEFLVLDPVHERMVPARFEFTGRIRRKVPLAKPGTSCEGRPQVANTEVELLVGVREVGLERKPIVVLATPPYLVLEDQVKCVRLPQSRGLFAGPP